MKFAVGSAPVPSALSVKSISAHHGSVVCADCDCAIWPLSNTTTEPNCIVSWNVPGVVTTFDTEPDITARNFCPMYEKKPAGSANFACGFNKDVVVVDAESCGPCACWVIRL